MSRPQWVSFHLFSSDPLDEMLRTAVAPFVDAVLADGCASSFFFIRYGEGGPHVRLRLNTTTPDVLRQRALHYFNSARESPYEPEVARYGGPKSLVVSERHFNASSRAVLAAMAEREWTYESAIGTALQLHIIFAHAMGLGAQEAGRLFAEMSQHFARARGWLPPGVPLERCLELFSESFDRQYDALVGLHRTLWAALEDGQPFEQPWANAWRRDNRDAAKRLRRARGLTPAEPWKNEERAILGSYIHMTNNRLGVLNRDEAYVGYALARGFEEMA